MTSPSTSPPPSPSSSPQPVNERTLLFTLAGIQFTHILDFMIMMPLGPVFTRLLGISDQQFGWLVSAYTFSAAISGLLAATYVDRFERKRLLLVLYVGFGLATIACGFAQGFVALLAVRIAAGFFGGVLSAMTNTLIGDLIPYERRGEATGIVMRAFAVATVLGVPAGLWMATAWGWRAPFFVIGALALLLTVLASRSLPRVDMHLRLPAQQSPHAASPRDGTRDSTWGRITTVLGDANHLLAYALMVCMVFGAFTVIPYITIYLHHNAHIPLIDIPLIYLSGGFATFFTARWFGRFADRHGKVRVYKLLAIAALVPVVLLTHFALIMKWLDVGQAPMWMVLFVSTLFFVFVSGRFTPGLAIITSAAQPALRGTFMSISGAVQSFAQGAATWLGGAVIARDAAGAVLHYPVAGYIAVGFGLVSLVVASRVQVHTGNETR
jgi:predicted MFS family arabinose efflux permease